MDYEDRPGLQDLPPKKEDWLEKRIEGFKHVCEAGEEIFWDRGRQYGDATAETGLMGAAITLTTDVARIRRILLDLDNLNKLMAGDEKLRESLRDAFIDAHNYAAICYYWLEQENFLGRAQYE